MDLISLLLFFTFAFYVYFSIYTYKLDPTNKLNQVFSVMSFLMAIWALGFVFMIPANTPEDALFWRKVAAVGWCTIYSVILHFTLILTSKESFLDKWWSYLVIYSPAIFYLYYYIFAGGMSVENFAQTDFGWTYLYSINMGVIDWLFHLYYTVYVAISIGLVYHWKQVTEFFRESKLGCIIILTFTIVFIFGGITDNILPTLGKAIIPPVAVVLALIPAYALHYSIKKYKFLSISPKHTIFEVVNNISDGLLLIKNNGQITMANPSACKLLEYDENQLVGQQIENILADNNSSFIYSLYDKNSEHKNIQNLERYLLTRTGNKLLALISASIITDEWDQHLELAFIFRDITSRKEAEEMHIKEVHHRVKNNLQVITSLLNLQSRTFQDETIKLALKDCQNRVASMSIAHERLYKSSDIATVEIGDYIKNLTDNIKKAFSSDNNDIEININSDNENIKLDLIVPLGLILNELITNTFKYAFPDQDHGELSIRFKVEDKEYILDVKDNGIGLPEDLDIDETNSLGLKVVKMLAQQINGTLEYQYNNGAHFTVKFPKW